MSATQSYSTGPSPRRGHDRLALPHLTRALVLDYVRNPVNLAFLVLVPAVFVVVAADTLAEAATLIGRGDQAVQVATAGWTASFLAGLAMYFQVAASRAADRRLVLAGFPARRLTAARLVTGLGIALAVTGVATMALAARGDLTAPLRVETGTLVAALIYLGLGAVVAVALPDPLNGSITLLFIWILDVFFGPVLGSSQAVGWRLLPTHFTSLWTVDLVSGHSGGMGDVGWSLIWLTISLGTAFAAIISVVPHRRGRRVGTPRTVHRVGTFFAMLTERSRLAPSLAPCAAATGLGLRQLARVPALWLLLAAVPSVFILLAEVTTPHRMAPITVTEGGTSAAVLFDLADIHGGTMAPIAIASLALLAGLFQSTDTRSADGRLVLAGYRWPALTAARCATAMTTAAVAVAASLLTASMVFEPHNWPAYAIGSALLAAIFVLLGSIAGPVVGKVAGAFMAFLVPFLDVGLGQSPMLHQNPPGWAHLLPGYGASRVLLDGALTNTFDEWAPLLAAVGWLIALLPAAGLLCPRPRPAARL